MKKNHLVLVEIENRKQSRRKARRSHPRNTELFLHPSLFKGESRRAA